MAEPEEMPVDKNGRRADMVMDGGATINRSNYGRFYEHYFNAVSFEVLLKVRTAFGIVATDKVTEHKVRDVYHSNPALFRQMYDYVMGWYEIVSPFNYSKLIDADDEVRINHLAYITQNKFTAIHLTLPTDNPVSYSHAVRHLEKLPQYRPLRDKVTYMHGGKMITSVNDVRIADLYVMLLEKTGDDWSAVGSGKLQNFGILAQITKGNKHSSPIRNQAIRAFGEAEIRNIISYCGEQITAELMDRNNNPATHREVVKSILKAPVPTNIENAVDRKKMPLGGSKPLQILHHMAMCLGWKFTYTPDPQYGVEWTTTTTSS